MFNENLKMKNAKGNKLRAYILIDISLVDTNTNFARNRKVFNCMSFRAGGDGKELLKSLFLSLEPPDHSN